MAKRILKEVICSFCIKSFIESELYIVQLPMHRFADGSYTGEYGTPCCKSCIDLKSTKKRILSISDIPRNTLRVS